MSSLSERVIADFLGAEHGEGHAGDWSLCYGDGSHWITCQACQATWRVRVDVHRGVEAWPYEDGDSSCEREAS